MLCGLWWCGVTPHESWPCSHGLAAGAACWPKAKSETHKRGAEVFTHTSPACHKHQDAVRWCSSTALRVLAAMAFNGSTTLRVYVLQWQGEVVLATGQARQTWLLMRLEVEMKLPKLRRAPADPSTPSRFHSSPLVHTRLD